jgi:CPA1 family monovalent cation:H+ antiporter
MDPVHLVLGLLAAVVVLATAARRLGVAYPNLLVVGGAALGLAPGLPRVDVPPDVVFLVFVPPLVYTAAAFTGLRDFRFNLRPIALLSVGLVLVTVLAVAGAAHAAVPGMGWPAAFVLATVVGPTDTVAVTAVTEWLHVPRRVVTVLEGESLVNDATALVAYRMAVVAVSTGSFSLGEACLRFVWASAGGVAVGLAVGWLTVWVRKRIEDNAVGLTVSLLTPFAAYLPAEELGVSGILATVAAGLYVGRRLSVVLDAGSRVQSYAFWGMVTFLLNGLAFILIGLELRAIVEDLASDYSFAALLGYGAAVSLAVVLTRAAWVFPATYLPRWLSRRLRERDPAPPWRSVAVVAWAGMRGVDSLAAALALPLVLADGRTPFPHRSLILFLAFAVIVTTLVFQGLSLPPLIRRLGLAKDTGDEHEETQARYAAAQAALERLEDLAPKSGAPPEAVASLRRYHQKMAHRYLARYDPDDDGKHEDHVSALHRLKRELLHAQRAAVLRLRDRDAIGDDVLRRIERDLDFEELRLEG